MLIKSCIFGIIITLMLPTIGALNQTKKGEIVSSIFKDNFAFKS